MTDAREVPQDEQSEPEELEFTRETIQDLGVSERDAERIKGGVGPGRCPCSYCSGVCQ